VGAPVSEDREDTKFQGETSGAWPCRRRESAPKPAPPLTSQLLLYACVAASCDSTSTARQLLPGRERASLASAVRARRSAAAEVRVVVQRERLGQVYLILGVIRFERLPRDLLEGRLHVL